MIAAALRSTAIIGGIPEKENCTEHRADKAGKEGKSPTSMLTNGTKTARLRLIAGLRGRHVHFRSNPRTIGRAVSRPSKSAVSDGSVVLTPKTDRIVTRVDQCELYSIAGRSDELGSSR